jgi:F-box protein 11
MVQLRFDAEGQENALPAETARESAPEIDHLPPPPPPPVPASPWKKLTMSLWFVFGLAAMIFGGMQFLDGMSGLTSKPASEDKPDSQDRPAAAAPAAPAAGDRIVVCERGTGQFTSLQAALAKAKPYDRILVKPGLYRGEIILDRPVEIVGDGPRAEIILESSEGDTVRMKTTTATLRNLTIRARGAGTGKKIHAVHLDQGRLTLEQCDLNSDSLASVCVHGSAQPSLIDCRLHDGAQGGMLVHSGGRPVVTGCTFENNALAGIVVEKGGQPLVLAGKFYRNRGDGILVRAAGEGCFVDCDCAENQDTGVRTIKSGKPTLRDCKIRNGKIGLMVADGGAGTFEKCVITANKGTGVVLTEQGDARLIDSAVRENGGNGLYANRKGNGQLLRCTLQNKGTLPVAWIGGESKVVLLGCTFPGGESNAIVVAAKGLGELLGCTIEKHKRVQVFVEKQGELVMRDCTVRHGTGNGVSVLEGGQVELTGCTLHNHDYAQVVVRGKGVLRNCKIHHSKDVGVLVLARGTVHVTDCELHDNNAGIVLVGGIDCIIEKSRFHDNASDGVIARDGTSGIVRDCDFRGNPGSIRSQPSCQLITSNNKVLGEGSMDDIFGEG